MGEMNGNGIRAIMFDMGNVLVDLDVENGIRAFVEDAGLTTIGDFLDPCHQCGFFGRFEAGAIDVEQFYWECISRSRTGTTRQTIHECIGKMIVGIQPYKADLLKKLGGKYDLCLLTNNNPIAMYYCSRLFSDAGTPLDTTFKHLFYSYEMKMMKPSPDFFEACISRTGFKPSEIVFVDDSKLNVDAARKLGIDARLYMPGSDMTILLKDLLFPL